MTDQRAPLYILSSEEPLLKQDRSSQLLQTARTQLPHASYLIFTEADFKSAGGPANLARLENELRDPGLFGGDRILKLYFKEYDNTAAQALMAVVRYFRPGLFVIVDVPRLTTAFAKLPAAKLPAQPNKRADLKKTAISCVKGIGGSLEIIYPPNPQELPQFIARRCQAYGFTIDPRTAALLASLNEGNLTAIDQALQLMVLNAKQGAITPDDLNTYFSDDSRFSVFTFAEALLSGQGVRALNILNAVTQAESGGAAAALPILISRLDSCLNVIVKLRGARLPPQQQTALLLSSGIVTPALKQACLQAAHNMPPQLLNFLIANLKECALLHSHFAFDEASALLQTMAVAVNNFGAMAYGAA